jgi:hypothetical protein
LKPGPLGHSAVGREQYAIVAAEITRLEQGAIEIAPVEVLGALIDRAFGDARHLGHDQMNAALTYLVLHQPNIGDGEGDQVIAAVDGMIDQPRLGPSAKAVHSAIGFAPAGQAHAFRQDAPDVLVGLLRLEPHRLHRRAKPA